MSTREINLFCACVYRMVTPISQRECLKAEATEDRGYSRI